jgi:hypothetical protein
MREPRSHMYSCKLANICMLVPVPDYSVMHTCCSSQCPSDDMALCVLVGRCQGPFWPHEADCYNNVERAAIEVKTVPINSTLAGIRVWSIR